MKIFHSLSEISDFNKKTSVAIGLFDGLHLGHRKVIQSAMENAAKNNTVCCVFTFQIEPGKKMLNKDATDRISSRQMFYSMLESMGVEMVLSLPFEEVQNLSPENFVYDILGDGLHVSYLSCGKDFHFGKGAKGDWRALVLLGKKKDIIVEASPMVTYFKEPISSTRIREAIRQGDMPSANDMLGYRYTIDFQVVEGNRIGRTLGAPTINQPFPEGFIVPRFGVYATLTLVGDKWYTSVSSVGVKPTIGDGYDALSETYIQNFDGDLYGQNIKVTFLQFIRKEVKFDDIEELRERIHQDIREADALGSLYI